MPARPHPLVLLPFFPLLHSAPLGHIPAFEPRMTSWRLAKKLGQYEPDTTHNAILVAWLSRCSVDLSLLLAASRTGFSRMRRNPSKDWSFVKSPVKERR